MGTQEKGEEVLYRYYQHYYHERWTSLYAALRAERSYQDIVFSSVHTHAHTTPYYIDRASWFASCVAADTIASHSFSHILDMCAAPGGKTLGLLAHIHALSKTTPLSDSISITINEKSKERFFRLKRNIDQFYTSILKEDSVAPVASLHFDNKDGCLYGKQAPHSFDFIVLDAPCSNERHVLANKKELEVWTPSRSTRIAHTQTALLCAAIDALREGGMVLYLTCSINHKENETRIAYVQKKRKVTLMPIDTASVLSMISAPTTPALVLEPLSCGAIVLPDTSHNAGPLYMCMLKKTGGNTNDT